MDKFEKLAAWGVDLPSTMERFLDDKDLYDDCLQTFIADEGFASLDKALKEKNYEQAFADAHTLKGVAGNLGLTPLFELICVLVEALRAHDYSNVEAQYAAVMSSFEEFKGLMGV